MLQSLLHLRTWARLGLGACLVAAGLAGSGSPVAAAEPIVLDLWPAGTPTAPAADVGEERELTRDPPDGVMRLTGVSVPQIEVFQPAEPNGTAVLVAPGGGYQILAYEHEARRSVSFSTSTE